MAERVRVREREAVNPPTWDDMCILHSQERLNYWLSRKIVITLDDREWEQSRQGRIYWYLMKHMTDDTALDDWWVFAHDIRTHSGGEHKHQGGLVIYVVEGAGYSLVNGEREDWEAGDLMLLPMVPGGIPHQHFNRNPGEPCRWVAFIYVPIRTALVSGNTQLSNSPDFKGFGVS